MVEKISAQELKNKLESGEDFTLVNALDRASFRSKRIPGSINIPSGLLDELSLDELPEKDEEIVIYCASTDCEASSKVAAKLESKGFSNIVEFEAGLAGWRREGYELEGDST